MALMTAPLDVTTLFNNNGKVNLDVGSYDYVEAQITGPSGQINFNHTNNANPTVNTEGNAGTAIDWQPLQMTNQGNGLSSSSTSSTGIFKSNVQARFIQFIGSSITVTKMLITFKKIS